MSRSTLPCRLVLGVCLIGAAGVRQHPLPQHRRRPAADGVRRSLRADGSDRRRARVRSPRPDRRVPRRSALGAGVRARTVRRADAPQASLLRDNGVYLLTGGLGHIPMGLANELATRSRLVSLSSGARSFRRAPSGGATSPRTRRTRPSREFGSCTNSRIYGVDFMVLRADVSDEWEVGQAVDRVYARYGALHGVIHGAGNVSAAGFFGIDQADRAARANRQFAAKCRAW